VLLERQLLMGRESVEDARRTGRPPISVFSFEFRVHSRRCHLPLFDVLPTPDTLLQQSCFPFIREILDLRFRHWRWVPHLLSEDQRTDRARQELMRLAALTAAEKRG
jgi:hypothetical protein